MSSTAEHAAAWVSYLNELLGQDREWVSALFLRRESCNYLIATRQHMPVENDAEGAMTGHAFSRKLEDIPKPKWSAGYLGLLNGFIGPGLEAYPKITAIVDPETKLIERFALTEDLIDERYVRPPPAVVSLVPPGSTPLRPPPPPEERDES